MSAQPKQQLPPTPEVTTEPQRLALEQMSNELISKLNKMVAEQEKRVQEFAQHRHSLSSLPTAPPLPTKPQAPIPPVPPPSYNRAANYPQPQQEPLPPVPSYPQTLPPAQHPPQPRQHNKTQQTPPVPRYSRKKQQQEENEGIGAGTIIFVLAIIFVLLKGC